ncbi:SIMPL domain-containing protein, partial [Bacteroides xylanisolvens]
NISRYLPFQAQSNVSMGTAATEQYRVIKLRYEMTARFAIK